MSSLPGRRSYIFGPYLLDVDQRQLLRNGQKVVLRPKIFDTLRALVENNDRLLHKEELMALVWPDVAVDESNLMHNLSVLRKVLGQDKDTQYVVTVRGRGYRFTAPVEATLEGSIAVRPFANMSPDPDQDFFCDGIAEEIIDALASVEGLRVVGRMSTFDRRLRDLSASAVGEKLGVSAILQGSLRKAGERLRISTQLIRTSDGTQLWSERYDRKLGDVFEIQETIARAVVEHVRMELLAPHPGPVVPRHTDNPDVHRLYLEARYCLNYQTYDRFRQAIGVLDRALKLQPDFARGHAQLALCYLSLAVYGFLPAHETVAKAEESINRALELNGSSVLAYRALGLLSGAFRWDWPAAQRACRRALQLDPGNPMAHYSYGIHFLSPVGRVDEAEREIRAAVDLDPLAPVIGQALCQILYYGRRYEEAAEQALRTLALEENFPVVRSLLAACYSAMGQRDDAVEARQAHLRITGRAEEAEAMGRVYAKKGEAGVLRRMVDQQLRRTDAGEDRSAALAILYAWLEEKEAALRCLEDALRARFGAVLWTKVHPAFDCLRDEPRFLELVDGMGVNDPRVVTPDPVGGALNRP
jgi:TolB-like protein/Tfp pilus assembly protein PilF